jgi:hypothetical protein
MANKSLTVEQIMARGEIEGFTAYQIAQLINAKLTAAGFEQIRPQMMYNYDRNGMIVKGQKDVTKTRTFTMAETIEFVEKFTTKRMSNEKYRIQEVQIIETESEECEGQLSLI